MFRNKIPVDLLAYMIKYMILFERESFFKEECLKNYKKCRNENRYRVMALNYDVHSDNSEQEDQAVKKAVKISTVPADTSDQKEKRDKNIRAKKGANKGKEEEKAGKPGKSKAENKGKLATNKSKMATNRSKMATNKSKILKKGKTEGKNEKAEIKTAKDKKALGNKNKSNETDYSKREQMVQKKRKNEDYSAKYLQKEPYILREGEFTKIYGKVETFLHKRGEINRDIYKYDDSPTNGPNLYIFISSFIEPKLPNMLYSIKIPINSYIFVGCTMLDSISHHKDEIAVTNFFEKEEVEEDDYRMLMKKYGNHFSFLSIMFIDQYAKKNHLKPLKVLESLKKDLVNFYNTFFTYVSNPKTCKLYEKIIMTKYVPNVSDVNFNSNHWMRKFLRILSNDLINLGYHFHKVTKLYKDYIKLIPAKKLKKGKPRAKLEMKFYNLLMDSIPNEIITVPFILDTLIAQACNNQRANIGYNIGDYKISKKKEENDVTLIEEKLTKLRKQYFPDISANPEPIKSKFILFGDKLSLNTHRFKVWGQLVRDRSNHILEVFFADHWRINKRKLKRYNVHDAYHYFNLLKACKFLNIKGAKSMIDLLLSVLSLGVNEAAIKAPIKEPIEFDQKDSMSAKSCNNSVDISVESNFPTVLGALRNLEKHIEIEQRNKYLKDQIEIDQICHKIKKGNLEKTFLDEINERLNDEQIIDLIKNTKYFEEMPKNVFLQTLWDALQECNSLDVQFVPLVNKLIYCCYDSPFTLIEEGLLPSRMCLRDFYKFGFDELKEFCEVKELHYYKERLRDLFCTQIEKLKDNIKDPIEPIKITKDLNLLKDDFEYPRRCNDLTGKNIEEAKPTPLKIIRKHKKKRQVFIPRLYNFGKQKRRISLFTIVKEYVLVDSTTIRFKIFSQTYKKPDVCFDMFQNGHHLIFHTPCYLTKKPKYLRFLHSSGINICFYEDYTKKAVVKTKKLIKKTDLKRILRKRQAHGVKRNTEGPNKTKDEIGTTGDRGEKEINEEYKDLPNIEDPQGNKRTKFECKFSLPNGLTIENKYTKDGEVYVKQYFLTTKNDSDLIKNEKCRLHLSDGTLVKMLEDNYVEIYFPCGRLVKYCLYRDFLAEEEEEEIYNLGINTNQSLNEEHGFGEEESAESVKKYYLLEPDGNFYTVVGEEKNLIGIKECAEYNDVFKNVRTVKFVKGPIFTFNGECIQTVTFPDGTRIVSEATIDDEEVFCDWSLAELKRWFLDFNDESDNEGGFCLDNRGESKSSAYPRRKYYDGGRSQDPDSIMSGPKIDLEQDGFLWVAIESVMVENPRYVSIFRFPSEVRKAIYILPRGIAITRFNNSCFDMEIESALKLFVRNNEIILEKSMQNELIQRSILWYKTFKTGYKANNEFFFHTSDKFGNWLTANKELTIKYNIVNDLDVTDESNFCEKCKTFHLKNLIPKYAVATTRRFIMDNELTGTELLHSINVDKFKNQIKNRRVKRKPFQEDPFIVNTYLIPMEKDYGHWEKRYANINNESVFILPSTYGPSWLFPFSDKDRKVSEDLPRVIVLRYLTEFIYENIYEVFNDLMKVFKILIIKDNKKMTRMRAIKLKKQKAKTKFSDRALPTTIVGVEARYLRKILYMDTIAVVNIKSLNLYKDIIFLPKIQENKFKVKNQYSSKLFIEKSQALHEETLVSYFDSPTGIVFYILEIIKKNAELIIAKTHLNVDMRHVLNKPMAQLSENDLNNIVIFLEVSKIVKNLNFKF